MHGTRTPRDDADTPALDALTYATSLEGGITREMGKRGFVYREADGRRITDRTELERIAALAIPPAYIDVLISSDPTTHLQATGRDARGRKQYRYHPGWSEARGKAKFALLPQFAASLPKIREQVDADLRRQRPGMEKALATVVWLLDNLLIRVGNATYAQENGSYGLTTLRNKHVKIEGSTVKFQFTGKSGKEWKLSHNDRRITRAIRMLQELPGQRLFQYLDADGKRHPISSQDVNAYIKAAAGSDFTSRQFRTWGATRHAATALAALEPGTSQRAITRQINAAVDSVATRMVNTRAVCRSSYIHPLVLSRFPDGALAELRKIRVNASSNAARWMDEDEIRLLRWLKRSQADV